MAIELAKAYVQIVPSAEGISGKLSDIMDGEADKAGKSSGGKLASGIGSALAGGAAAIGAGLAAGVGAIGNLTKSALSTYANYEQLTGGVETLFGDSASVILNYANNAYQTAGLSANEYMKTVTSFSASLLQSLDGDTEDAAQYAQLAITDMADNANKMGTSMESIQNAYQGFAKQNYTMLDNLKLGYGGTKSEMQRLLEDATELSGIEYDIDSYADVVAAIHVVQDNLGITGTTAKEASTTISGSIGSMKSAWTNFLTSMNGSPDQIEASTNALVDSVVTAAGNIIPKLSAIVPNIITGLSSVIQALLPEIPNLLNTMLPTLIEGASALVGQVVELLPEILASLAAVIPDIITAITTNLPLLLNAALDIIMALMDALLDNLDLLINAGIDLILALGLGLIDAVPKLTDKIPEIITKLVATLTNPDTIKKLLGAGAELLIALVKGIAQALPELVMMTPMIIIELIKGIKDMLPEMKGVGKDLISGLWTGIKESWSSLVSGVKDLGSNLLGGIKDIFGIHSPSKEFAYIGEMCDEGLAQGLSGMEETVVDTKKMLKDEMGNGAAFDTAVNVNRILTANNAANNTAEPRNMSEQIAAAVYSAMSGMNFAANLTGTPDTRKFFESMRVEARFYKNKTGREAFI